MVNVFWYAFELGYKHAAKPLLHCWVAENIWNTRMYLDITQHDCMPEAIESTRYLALKNV